MISRPVAVEYPDMAGSFVYVAPSKVSQTSKAARKVHLPSFRFVRYARKSNLRGTLEVATRPALAPFLAESKAEDRTMVCLPCMELTAVEEVQWFVTGGKGFVAKHETCAVCHVQ